MIATILGTLAIFCVLVWIADKIRRVIEDIDRQTSIMRDQSKWRAKSIRGRESA